MVRIAFYDLDGTLISGNVVTRYAFFARNHPSRLQAALKEGKIPAELVLGSKGYRNEMIGFTPPGGVYVHICGTDLIRDADGRLLVLEDNGRTPSGVSYVLEKFMEAMVIEAPGKRKRIGRPFRRL